MRLFLFCRFAQLEPLVENMLSAACGRCVFTFFSVCACLQLDPLPTAILEQRPNANAVHSLEKVLETHSE